MTEALIAARFVQFVAVMAVFGSLAFRVYAVGGAAAPVPAFDRWLEWVVAGGALIALLAALAVLSGVAAGMAANPAAAFDPGTIAAVLTDTEFGHIWCGRLVVAAALVAIALLARWRGLQLVLAALLLASLGWVGHAAMAAGPVGLGHRLNQTLHLLAGGLWLGGLIPLGWLLRRVRRRGGPEWVAMLHAALPPFSRMGYGAVTVLALTGAVNTALLVGSAGRLLTTPYGRLLTLKIVLFIIMVGVAAGNRFRLAPRLLAGAESPDALAQAVLAEQVLGLAILAVVSVLGTWAPAAQGAAM